MSDTANTADKIAEAIEKKLESMKVSDDKHTNSEERIRKRRLPTAERIRLWEEEQKNKVVLQSGIAGKVKWYSVLGRYGFISRDDGEKDVFVHQTAIAKSITNKFYLRTLADGESIMFDLVEGTKGPEAGNVTGPDGGNVIGSRFRHLLLSRFRRNRKPRNNTENHETDEKPRKIKNKKRRNRKQVIQHEDGTVKAVAKTNEDDDDVKAAPCRKIVDETAKTDRSEEVNLGAQAIDAQI